jgi:hypothetical protein
MLYHTVPIKTDWLSAEVREEAAFPPDIAALFPYGVRDAVEYRRGPHPRGALRVIGDAARRIIADVSGALTTGLPARPRIARRRCHPEMDTPSPDAARGGAS